MRHTLSIDVADQPGELSRIVGLFSARGFNIETVSVGQTLDPENRGLSYADYVQICWLVGIHPNLPLVCARD